MPTRTAREAKRSADAAEREAVAAEVALPPSLPAVPWKAERRCAARKGGGITSRFRIWLQTTRHGS
jgi:hypothetical protein